MRILERYLLKELIIPYGFTLLVSLFLLTIGRIIQIAKYLFQTSVTLKDIAELIILATPRLLTYALPLTSAVSIAVALNRLSSCNELIAIEGSGIPIRNLSKPFWLFTAFNVLIAMVITLTILHHANTLFREKIANIGKSSVMVIFQEGIFIDSLPGFILYFQKVSPRNFSAEGVYMEDLRDKNTNITIVAQKALLNYDQDQGAIVLDLQKGTIIRISRHESGQVVEFEQYSLTISVGEIFRELSKASSTKWEMNMKELWNASHTARTREERSRYGIEFHTRIVMPFLSIILGMMMVPFFKIRELDRFSSRASAFKVLIAFGLFLLFYLMITLGKGLAENGVISPAMAVYGPAGIFLSWFVYLWKRGHQRVKHERGLGSISDGQIITSADDEILHSKHAKRKP
ncbi:MAG: LptF/LptG family permease [Thermodesulforhabdaceae bacterium]